MGGGGGVHEIPSGGTSAPGALNTPVSETRNPPVAAPPVVESSVKDGSGGFRLSYVKDLFFQGLRVWVSGFGFWVGGVGLIDPHRQAYHTTLGLRLIKIKK